MYSYLIYIRGRLGEFDPCFVTDDRAKAYEYGQKYGYSFMRLRKI